VAIKKPRLHPVIRLVGGEWEEATAQKRAMNWGKISLPYLQGVCRILAEQNPDWHRDLHGMELGNYLVGVLPEKMWWHVNPPALQEPEDSTSEKSYETSVHILTFHSHHGRSTYHICYVSCRTDYRLLISHVCVTA
jgi:hypothetical protein